MSDAEGGSFDILDGCASNVVGGMVISGDVASNDNYFAMQYTAFVFNSDGGDHHLTLSCDVTVCTLDNCPNACS